MEIKVYDSTLKAEWDKFVLHSKNGTFLICRNFMDYHSLRFRDHSLLIYKKAKLIALLPANIDQDILYSHQGLTYGGLILNSESTSLDIIAIFDLLTAYLRSQHIRRFVYKPIPHIYHIQPSEEDLYALFRQNASLTSRSITSCIQCANKVGYNQLRKRKIKKASALDLQIIKSDLLAEFWTILEDNLLRNHQTKPVHSFVEIQSLKELFPNNIQLFTVSKGSSLLGGCLVFETTCVAHLQYISANEEGKQLGALDLLFDHLINTVFANKAYLDFGTSTENNGQYLNEGLISQKEGFGARGIIYDTYEICIKEEGSDPIISKILQ